MPNQEEIRAIPLWINGHAYLTMAPAFIDVRDARNQQIKRRTPRCGSLEAAAAVAAAEQARLEWSERRIVDRSALLGSLADALSGYAEHFAGLLGEETGWTAAQATAEIASAGDALRSPAPIDAANGVIAILCDRHQPFLAVVRLAASWLLAGSTVILKPSPHVPSALFALAELATRCGFPGGVINVLHGDLEVIEALFAIDSLPHLRFAGEPAAAARIAAIAAGHGKTLSD
ncbi:MAG: aldehyde dehydrogenase family protein [Candidatus Accumulibacter sp.]|nr:aldehyde dehydrogenase family protein [Accumulibacter sp.]